MTNGTGSGGTGALHGLTVLDLTGPQGQPCGRILADLGADVILIEPPSGSPSRRMAPFAHGEAGPDNSLFFVHFNTNKRGIRLDLDSGQDRARLLELVKNADVVLESGHPGEMEALGLAYDDLAAVNPGVVVTSITPFGRTGPYRDFVGADIAVTALGGSVYPEGEAEGPPVTMPRYQGFQLSSIHAAFGTLIALWHRRTTGRGQHLDVSMTEVHAHKTMNLMRYAAMSEVMPRRGSKGGIGPTQYFQASDGVWVQLALTSPRQWVEFANWVNHPMLLDPAMRELSGRDGKADEITAIAGEFISTMTAEEYLSGGVERHVTVAPANTPADFAAHPHAEVYGFFSPMEHPVLGKYMIPGGTARFDASPLSVRRPAPLLGQHQDEVLGAAPVERQAVPVGGSNGASDSGLPLDGVRILAFERVWAAPFGTRFIADYGADVIKVESTKFADGRVHDREGNPTAWRSTNAAYGENNRNKRSIAIDLHTPDGQELFRRLAAEADVVVENNAPGAIDRFNINYDLLKQVNPRLIMVSCPGYGAMGPMRDFTAVGQCLTSFTGLGYLWAQPDAQWPARGRNAYPDFITAGNLALSIMAALHYRDRTGEGQYIEIPQFQATASMIGMAFLETQFGAESAEAWGNRDPNAAPQGVYQCGGGDRWCAISCPDDDNVSWRALTEVIGRPELADDPRFATFADRQANHDALDEEISAWTRTRSAHQVMYTCQRAGIAAGMAATGEDLYLDPQLRSRGYVVEVNHNVPGPIEHPGMTIKFSESPGRVRMGAPTPGLHTREVLTGILGLSDEEYAGLEESGAIG